VEELSTAEQICERKKNIEKKDNLQTVLFDLDGTLIESTELGEKTLQRLHQKYSSGDLPLQAYRKYRGLPTREILAHFDPQDVELLLAECVQVEEALRHLSYIYPGIESVLGKLRQAGLKIGVVTAQTCLELESVRRYFQLEEYVQVWVSADDVPNPKPHPDSLLRALDLLRAQPERAIMIGDTPFDIEAGKRAGLLTAAALWGCKEKDWLLACQPDLIFEKPQELLLLCPTPTPTNPT
jgi:pyrophosphatase PpaX